LRLAPELVPIGRGAPPCFDQLVGLIAEIVDDPRQIIKRDLVFPCCVTHASVSSWNLCEKALQITNLNGTTAVVHEYAAYIAHSLTTTRRLSFSSSSRMKSSIAILSDEEMDLLLALRRRSINAYGRNSLPPSG
jgi:hypothetical protein